MKTIILSVLILFTASLTKAQDIKLINDVKDMKIKVGGMTKTSLKSNQHFRLSCKVGDAVYEADENGKVTRTLFTMTPAMCGKEMKLSDALNGKYPSSEKSETSEKRKANISTSKMTAFSKYAGKYFKVGDQIVFVEKARVYYEFPCIPGEMMYEVNKDGKVVKELFKIDSKMCGKGHDIYSKAYMHALGL